MNVFDCACGQRVYFENSVCLACGRQLGFSPEEGKLIALDDSASNRIRCARFSEGCNWLLSPGTPGDRCMSCALIGEPLAPSGPLQLEMDAAQRRLVYSLLRLQVPVLPKSQHPLGLEFRFPQSSPDTPVITGHDDGIITIDLAEADPAKREAMRVSMGESYRTLLGHFRHEVGHYMWQLLFDTEPRRESFRQLFGDERQDYQEALKKHYASPRTDFEAEFVSQYATSHPWEDWAETWAHYLHLLDSWEIARSFGISVSGGPRAAPGSPLDDKINEWVELMMAINSLNRSLGHADPYPFAIPDGVRTKLNFIDETVARAVPRLIETVSIAPAA